MSRLSALLIALFLPLAALAAGDGTVPATTNPNAACKAGEVFDRATKACVPAQSGALQDADRLDAARYFSFAGAYDAAQIALRTLATDDTAEALTLRGFTARKLGDMETAMAHYTAALARDPNHWEARSYMGQGFVEMGNSKAARAQLSLIRTTGGRGTWAEISLRQAIERGAGYRY
jgi:tetratricopeptide (TPR) repeat protein